jgi:hypothetical protein
LYFPPLTIQCRFRLGAAPLAPPLALPLGSAQTLFSAFSAATYADVATPGPCPAAAAASNTPHLPLETTKEKKKKKSLNLNNSLYLGGAVEVAEKGGLKDGDASVEELAVIGNIVPNGMQIEGDVGERGQR